MNASPLSNMFEDENDPNVMWKGDGIEWKKHPDSPDFFRELRFSSATHGRCLFVKALRPCKVIGNIAFCGRAKMEIAG